MLMALFVLFFQDLEDKNTVDVLKPELMGSSTKAQAPQVTSLCWSSDGQTLFAGYTDNLIRVWKVTISHDHNK